MSSWEKGAAWTKTSKADIAGNVPKVAQELDKKLKGKYSGNLSLQIKDGGNNFSYSAEITEGGRIKIINKFTLCEIGADARRPPYSCSKCGGGCGSGGALTGLGDYLKNYNIGLEVSAAR